jgi:hypothetical protein
VETREDIMSELILTDQAARIQISISGPKLLATGFTGYRENQKNQSKTGANLNFENEVDENTGKLVGFIGLPVSKPVNRPAAYD